MKGSASLYDAICTHCLPYLTPEMEVLELACGSGQFSFRLAERVRQWTATDFSEKMVLEAQKRSGPQSLTFEMQDATNLPYPAESFDAVLIANALHIMPSPDRALEEIHRVPLENGHSAAAWHMADDTGGLSRISQMECTGIPELCGSPRVYGAGAENAGWRRPAPVLPDCPKEIMAEEQSWQSPNLNPVPLKIH